ncbi:hypothetical protein [Aurantimonas sp. VKM B-3413]|uniref:hypothetical protein n=1 Tax=Aurantimonas sp. VKM B-3413 TaxID=2779401 RepID=UPI001E4BD65D|nr:hypothetical protein [Aurantimonas sp. VKM B-3413]MCB8840178.1 hypothetical protein [Aurantimonas sp. VKM B-3413]
MLSMLFASVGSVGAETLIMSSQSLAMAMVAQADMAGEPGHAHDGHHAPAKAHDHEAAGGSDCAAHCLTAVPQAFGPTDTMPVSRNLAYPILTTDLTGQSGPTTERPPRI